MKVDFLFFFSVLLVLNSYAQHTACSEQLLLSAENSKKLGQDCCIYASHVKPGQVQRSSVGGIDDALQDKYLIHSHEYHHERSPIQDNLCICETKAPVYEMRYSAIFEPIESGWHWCYNYAYSSFRDTCCTRADRGLRIESLNVYQNSSNFTRYAGTWAQDDNGWAYAFNYSFSKFADLLDQYTKSGYRITDIEYNEAEQEFSAIWIKDSKGWYYAINFGYDDFIQELAEKKQEGYRPINFQVYYNPNRNEHRYACIWVQNTDGYGWAWALNQTFDDIKTLLQEYKKENLRLIDFESYPTSDGMRYSAVCVNDHKRGAWALNYSDAEQFRDAIRSFRNDENYRPISFEFCNNYCWKKVNDPNVAVSRFDIISNYPNPFNPTTTIEFSLPSPQSVEIQIFNLAGVQVGQHDEVYTAGVHDFTWNAHSHPSGVYVIRLTAENKVLTRKCMLIR